MRAAEIRFFWYRAELFSLFSRLPRARCSRGAPFLFFPSSTRRAKKTRGASETTRQWYASNEFKSLPKEHVFRKRRIPSLSCCSQKVLDRKGTARKGVLPRKTRAHKVASQKEDAKRLFGGRGRVSNLRERASRLLGKEDKGRQNRAPILFFF